ncbi:hypothetical protein A6R68_10134 [Neotoma lepida]|uniref:Uncharacterized protein n=1 Tax=Neotoma lepida TaxID=56216 RepID=A0A1A6FY07_NEOLE|nr:hypothetical protein A6R68_10134 [Neotoma lepida]
MLPSLPEQALLKLLLLFYKGQQEAEDPHLKDVGFTKLNADKFEDMAAEKWFNPDGCGVKHIPNRNPLDKGLEL